MTWYSSIKRISSADPWGYWILPDGSLLPVSTAGHTLALVETDVISIDDLSNKSHDDLYIEAYKRGFIRVNAPEAKYLAPSLLFEFQFRITPAQSATVKELIMKYHGKHLGRCKFLIIKGTNVLYNDYNPQEAMAFI